MNLTRDRAITQVEQAQMVLKQNRREGWEAFNRLFRQGTVPARGLNGRYHGQLLALNIAPGLTQLFTALTNWWLPWEGKHFYATQQSGNNIFSRQALALSYVFMPFYRVRIPDGPSHFRAFNFRTYTAPGLQDPDRQVFVLNYNLPENPAANVRRVVDELVEIEPGYYLGKAHLKTWFGTWQQVAYFSLAESFSPQE